MLAYYALAYLAVSLIAGPFLGKLIAYGTGDIDSEE